MQSEKELDQIRKEMINVKDCITKYIGYIFTGSGAAVYGIARMDKSDVHLMAIVSIAISAIISFVVLVIFYKFFSHNRFAGYCKLLSHEKNAVAGTGVLPNLYSWEVAIGQLRCSDVDVELITSLLDNDTIVIKNINREKLKGRILAITDLGNKRTGKIYHGLKIIIQALLGHVRTHSWAFPPYVTSICLILTFGFLLAGTYLAIASHIPLVIAAALIAILFQLILWIRLCDKLYDLMEGSNTVEAFFLKLIPIRAGFLKEYGIEPEYINMDNLL